MKHKHLLIIMMVVLADQLSKFLVRGFLLPVSNLPILRPFLYFTYSENTGAGFSLFNGQNTALIFLMMIIIGLLLFYFDKFKGIEKIFISLVLGGAIGNLIDRIFLGHVIDFINFRVWPIFNLADCAISIGVACLILFSLKKKP